MNGIGGLDETAVQIHGTSPPFLVYRQGAGAFTKIGGCHVAYVTE